MTTLTVLLDSLLVTTAVMVAALIVPLAAIGLASRLARWSGQVASTIIDSADPDAGR